jgi:hypothetical protein
VKSCAQGLERLGVTSRVQLATQAFGVSGGLLRNIHDTPRSGARQTPTMDTVPSRTVGDLVSHEANTAINNVPLWLIALLLLSLIPGGYVFWRLHSTGRWQFILGLTLVSMPITSEFSQVWPFMVAVFLWLLAVGVGLAMVLFSSDRVGRHRDSQ